MKKYRVIILKMLRIILYSLIIGLLANSSVENVGIQIQISQFKNKGVYQSNLSSQSQKFYKVSRETWMVDLPSYSVINGNMYYGYSGDILVGLESSIHFPGINELATFFVGGHASFVCYDYNENGIECDCTKIIEASPDVGSKVAICDSNFWNDNDYRTEVIGLRIKASEETKKKAFNKMINKLGKKYNYSFLFNTKNTYYCTDLISRSFEPYGIDLNYDGFYCSVQDLIYSNKTYISFYKEYKKGVSYFYYLG